MYSYCEALNKFFLISFPPLFTHLRKPSTQKKFTKAINWTFDNQLSWLSDKKPFFQRNILFLPLNLLQILFDATQNHLLSFYTFYIRRCFRCLLNSVEVVDRDQMDLQKSQAMIISKC